MSSRERVTLYLDRDTWNRLRAACDKPWMPLSASKLVDTYLAQITPLLEQLNDRAEAGDVSGIYEVMREMVADQVTVSGGVLTAVGTDIASRAGKETMP